MRFLQNIFHSRALRSENEKLRAFLDAQRERNGDLYRENWELRERLAEEISKADAWRALALEEAGRSEKMPGEYRIAYVPMLPDFPFPEYFEAARLRALDGGQYPEAVVRVLYRVGQFDNDAEVIAA